MRSPEQLEQRRVKAVAAEYRRKGYDVVVHPRTGELPEFLKPLHPDIIATTEGDNVVVEVKAAQNLGRSKDPARIAEAVEGCAGWCFELIVTSPKGPLRYSDVAELPELGVQAERLQSARHIARMGSLEAALLLAWAAVEGILRSWCAAEQISVERRATSYVLHRLYSDGLLAEETYEALALIERTRNAVAHGMVDRQIDAKLVEQVLGMGDRLHGEVRATEPAPN